MVKIQIVSDIHLEFRGENFNKIIKPSAPILCLLGDVCACGNDGDFLVYKKFVIGCKNIYYNIKLLFKSLIFELVSFSIT